MLRTPRSTALVVSGFLLGIATAAFAVGPADLLASRKTASSSVAITLPMHEHPPAACDKTSAGWMYFDVDMRQGGAQGCICVHDSDATFQWATFGSVIRECD